MNGRCLSNDKAECVLVAFQSAITTIQFPCSRFYCCCDQVYQSGEVRAVWVLRRVARNARTSISTDVDRQVVIQLIESATEVVAGVVAVKESFRLLSIHGDDKVSNVVDACMERGFLFQWVCDLQNFVLNAVNQTTCLLQQEFQSTLQRNSIDVDTDGLLNSQSVRFDGSFVHGDIDAVIHGDVSNDFFQRHIVEVQRDGLIQCLFDLFFTWRSLASIRTAIAFTSCFQSIP